MLGIELKPTPVADYFESEGYKPEVMNGKKYFKHFDSVENETNSLLTGVGLKEISDSAIIELKGKDVLDLLHRISTNSLKDLLKENFKRTIFTNEKGKIIDLATIVNFGDHQLLISSDYHKEKVIKWVEKYVIMDDVQVTDSNGKYVLLGLLGPQADSFMTLICGNSVNEIKPGTFKAVRSEGIIFFLAKHVDRKGYFKYYILADPVNAIDLIKYMRENKGPYDFNLIGDDAYSTYRIMYGIPSAPNELNDVYNPHETKLLDYVSFTKGCYIGQEVIARLDTYSKVQKFLCGVTFNEPVDADKPFSLFNGTDTEAGLVTSSIYSVRCNRHIGLAYIRKEYTEEGTELTARSNGKEVHIKVENFPIRKR